jgi:hypothetical protein
VLATVGRPVPGRVDAEVKTKSTRDMMVNGKVGETQAQADARGPGNLAFYTTSGPGSLRLWERIITVGPLRRGCECEYAMR